MLRAVGRLVVQMVIALVVSTFAVRLAIEISFNGGIQNVLLFPGTPLDDPRAQPIVEAYRLDQSLIMRHIGWMSEAIRGDFGTSLRNRGADVETLISPRLPITFQLAIMSLTAAIAVGVPIGTALAGLHRRLTGPAQILLSTAQAVPVFVSPFLLVWLFTFQLELLDPSGWIRPSVSLTGNLKNSILPVLVLALPEAALIAQLVRSSLRDVLGEEFVTAAHAKGLPHRYVLLRHALRPASFTLITQIALIFGSMLGGIVVVEQIFSIGGLGVLLFESIVNRDLHVLMTLTAYLTGIIVLVRSAADLLYRVADPRISFSETQRR